MTVQRVPSPAETPAEVIVSGHTSTLRRIRIVKTGNLIPVTFSRDLMSNSPGFAWHVSQHFALKTDFADARARELLTLLELAYPHYVALFGREIPGLAWKRMACVYGSSMEKLEVAMRDDHMHVFAGGGITQEGFWACYQVSSNEYHCRYILLHECVHLYQYCLERSTTNTGGSFLEGIADRLASHVFEPRRQRLTVNVLDRAPVHNFLEYGRKELRKNRKLGFKDLVTGGDRGFNVLVTTYLQRTPEALQKWRLYRDEMFRTSLPATKQQTEERLIRRLYGRPDDVWADFKAWAKTARPTFFMADWGFDQYGDTLVSFGNPREKQPKRFSQMDIDLVPARKHKAGLFFMDYPAQPLPPIVGPVRRGGSEPAVGCVVDFSLAHGRGQAGLGLGRIGRTHFRVLIDRAAQLVLDGTDLRGTERTWRLPAAVRKAIREDGGRAGLTVSLGEDRVRVTVRAGRSALHEFHASMRMGKAQRLRLLRKPMAILGVGARHLVTPFLDDGRLVPPDLNVPAPSNPWRNTADAELFAAYRACWRLGQKAPASLRHLRDALLRAAEAGETAQRAAVAAFRRDLPAIVGAIRTCRAGAELKGRVLGELSGCSLYVELRRGGARDSFRATARLRGPSVGSAEGVIGITAGPGGRNLGPPLKRVVSLPAGVTRDVAHEWRRPPTREPFAVSAEGRLRWLGATLVLRAQAVGDAAFPRCWYIGPFDNGGKLEDREHPIEKTALDLTRVYYGQTGTLVPWRRFERDPALPVDAESLLYFNRLFAQQANHAFAYVAAWVHSATEREAVLAVGASDGLAVWVNGEKVFANVCRRDWSPREDKIPVRLRKGRNRLLLKSLHGTGLWFLSPNLEDGDGKPLARLRTECGEHLE